MKVLLDVVAVLGKLRALGTTGGGIRVVTDRFIANAVGVACAAALMVTLIISLKCSNVLCAEQRTAANRESGS